jgi:UDP-glucose 4-epimerase
MYCSWFHTYHGLPTVTFRFFNSYGPNEVPGNYRNVIPNFFWWAMDGRPLPITGTGHETRDFIFVGDLVAGLIAGAFTPQAAGEVFNLGTSIQTEVIDLATRINEHVGNQAGVVYHPRRDWDHSEKKAADVSKAQRVLGWEPRVRLPEGLEQTWRWFQDRRDDIKRSQAVLVG